MESFETNKKFYHPTVFIFSEPNSFSLYLLESLLSGLCNIVIFTNKINTWKNLTSYITKTGSFIIDSEKNCGKYPKPDSFLVVDFLETNTTSLIQKTNELSQLLNSKGFVIVLGKSPSGLKLELSETVGAIFLDNLFGPRMELNNTNRISQIISSAISGDKIKVGEGEKILPVYMGGAAKLIVKWLFSFGPYGEAVSISSNREDVVHICQIAKKVFPEFKYHVMSGVVDAPKFGNIKIYLLKDDSNKLFEETLIWFKNNIPKKTITNKSIENNSKVIKIIAAVLLVLAAPFICILVAVSLLFVSVKFANSEKLNMSKYCLNIAYVVSKAANIQSKVFSAVPVMNLLYDPAVNASNITKNLSVIGQKTYKLAVDTSLLVDNILGKEEYDFKKTQQEIASTLGFIGTNILSVEADVKNYPNLNIKSKVSVIKKIVVNANKIVLSLSDLLGMDKTKTYLVVFQNNMELRPTGGFIGSFALISFNSGKLGEIIIQDVYSADGQLKGHIEPPSPIKKYLGEANWFLRDSNWDPDFSVSAERAEWFLDKEIDVKVDGVMAVDLNLIKDLLGVVGPVYLDDYQTQITEDNFYEKTQSEVEKNFFPGSSKKAGFITALSKEMVNTLVLNNEKNKVKLAKIIYQNLESKHIQIYLHNKTVKEALANLNWDGGVSYPKCSQNCHSDFLGLIEANLGVNKANYYISRKYNLLINLEDKLIKKSLTVVYKNSANPGMGNSGIYKVYLRIMLPFGSFVDSIKMGDSNLTQDNEMVSGRKEVGVYFEILPGQSKMLNVSLQDTNFLRLSDPGEYRLYLRKQAGTPSEPIEIGFNTGSGVDLRVDPGYNTIFSKDIFSKVTWKK